MKRILLLASLFLFGCSQSPLRHAPITLDELGIQVTDTSREVGYTNKQAGFFYTESSGPHRNAWQGWHIMSTKMMNDYALFIDSTELSQSGGVSADVFPHQLRRYYRNGAKEIVTMLDSIDAIVVEIEGAKGNSVTMEPEFDESQRSEDYEVAASGSFGLIAKKRHLNRTDREDYPVWIAVGSFEDNIDVKLVGYPHGTSFAPLSVTATPTNGKVTFVLVAGDTKDQTVALARNVASQYQQLIASRKARMERLLNDSYLRTSNRRFEKAMQWTKLSMDALLMNQRKPGIFAGLPWFSNYWGRDSFISLPGATLVTGHYAEANAILRSFAEWQQNDPNSPDEGRIPNLVTTTSIAYNTTDGTLWFTSALYDYLNYSGDVKFVEEMYPVVKRAIEGALRHRVDGNYFLTHGDAETWMDAVGPEGPWSPRGNRANDIQALWIKELSIGIALAREFGDQASATRWQNISDQLFVNFQNAFVDTTTDLIYDHLNADGSPDHQLRPNQLFALDLVQNQNVKEHVFRTVTENLVYEHGVASLSQDDPNFHPYHHYEPTYVQDAAYHNGVVWTWLQGVWIKTAAEYGLENLAYRVTDNTVHQMLDRGAVGTISELLDAAPRPGEREPRLSGTFSQAWSLAEFIRNFYQSYLGVTVDATNNRLLFYPRLPKVLSNLEFTLPVGNERIRILCNANDASARLKMHITEGDKPIAMAIGWPFKNGKGRNLRLALPPNKTVDIRINQDLVYFESGSDEVRIETSLQDISTYPELADLKLAAPVVHPDLKALKGPTHRLLSNQEIRQTNPQANLLVDATDPVGDDKGSSGTYGYPASPNFKPGILDITHALVSADDKNVYFNLQFQNLTNPGWHPEYGFQLTYVAIAIDKDGKAASGQNRIGRNAHVGLPRQMGYESVVYVGGGIRIEDAGGAVLAEYLPRQGDEKNPLGNVATRTISFALPTELLGKPTRDWKFYFYVGAQDDHGGAGIGDFRSVNERATEWSGGGKKRAGDSNAFDILIPY